MNLLKRKRAFTEWIWSFLLLFLCIGIILRPERAASGVSQGLLLCTETLIPALFPFMILSSLFLESRFANLFFFLNPFLKLLHIHSRKAGAALACGILSGFAPGAKAVDSLYRSGELTRCEAERMLVCCVGISPGFILNGVGVMMLKNINGGWLLFLSQLGAQAVCGAAAAFWMHPRHPHSARSIDSQTHPKAAARQNKPSPTALFCESVQSSIRAILMLCGTVTFFSFLTHMLTPANASPFIRYLASVFLEVTSACRAACETNAPYRSTLCCAALSLMGSCIFLQVRSLVSPSISLRPLVLSRILHLPCSLVLFRVLAKCFPHALTANVHVYAKPLIAIRMPADVLFFLFLLCALACGLFPAQNRLRSHAKDV